MRCKPTTYCNLNGGTVKDEHSLFTSDNDQNNNSHVASRNFQTSHASVAATPTSSGSASDHLVADHRDNDEVFCTRQSNPPAASRAPAADHRHMNGTDGASIRSTGNQQRDNFVNADDVSASLSLNTASSSGVGGSTSSMQQQMSSIYSTGANSSMPQAQQPQNDMGPTGNGSARSHSSSSLTGISSAAGAHDRVTPPTLQLPLAASMFNAQMALSHYGSSFNAVAALNGAGGPFRTPSVAMGGNGVGSLRRYTCKLCNDMFDTKAELQLHAQVHMREAKPYKCSHCPKSFANSSYLSQHMRIHLGIKPFGPCQYCQRKFTQLSHLQQHLRTHTGEKPYKCRFLNCEKAFSQLSNLQSHSRCHQSDKPFKCNSCYKCFGDEASLLEHIPKHKESKHLKVHICGFCGKSYTQSTYLAKHMTKHSDRKPLKGVGSGANSVGNLPGSTIAASCMSTDNGVGTSTVDDHHGSAGGMWSPRDLAGNSSGSCLCPIHGVIDSCGDLASPNAFPFNSFHQQLNPAMMQSQTCAYTSAGIASTMAAAAGGRRLVGPFFGRVRPQPVRSRIFLRQLQADRSCRIHRAPQYTL